MNIHGYLVKLNNLYYTIEKNYIKRNNIYTYGRTEQYDSISEVN